MTTLILATSSSVICCVFAAPMGWLVARTDMPLRRTVRALVTASFVTPPFLGAIAWELLAAPNSGLINKVYRAVTGVPRPPAICAGCPYRAFGLTVQKLKKRGKGEKGS